MLCKRGGSVVCPKKKHSNKTEVYSSRHPSSLLSLSLRRLLSPSSYLFFSIKPTFIEPTFQHQQHRTSTSNIRPLEVRCLLCFVILSFFVLCGFQFGRETSIVNNNIINIIEQKDHLIHQGRKERTPLNNISL